MKEKIVLHMTLSEAKRIVLILEGTVAPHPVDDAILLADAFRLQLVQMGCMTGTVLLERKINQ